MGGKGQILKDILSLVIALYFYTLERRGLVRAFRIK